MFSFYELVFGFSFLVARISRVLHTSSVIFEIQIQKNVIFPNSLFRQRTGKRVRSIIQDQKTDREHLG